MKFYLNIQFKKGKDKEIGEYYIGNIKGTPFITQGTSKDDCIKQTFEMIAGFTQAFPEDYRKHLRKYRMLK